MMAALESTVVHIGADSGCAVQIKSSVLSAQSASLLYLQLLKATCSNAKPWTQFHSLFPRDLAYLLTIA